MEKYVTNLLLGRVFGYGLLTVLILREEIKPQRGEVQKHLTPAL
jgi:hypothetical protein